MHNFGAKAHHTYQLIRSPQNNPTDERSRRLILTSLVSFISKGVSFLVLLVSVPLTLGYLGSTQFGLLNTITGIFGMLTYSDLGISMGVQNTLPDLVSKGDDQKVKEIISTAFFFLIGVSFVIAITSFGVIPYFDWTGIFNVKDKVDASLMFWTVWTSIFVVCIGIPAGLIQRIQSAYQQGYFSETFVTLGNIMSLVALVCVTQMHLSLAYIVFAMQGVLFLTMVFNFWYFTRFRPIYSAPTWSSFSINTLKRLITIGLSYLLLTISSVAVGAADNFIIARYIGVEAVTDYTIGFKLVSIFYMPVLIISLPFLASYNDAVARQDIVWVRLTILKYLKYITLGSMLGGIVLYFFGNDIIYLWTRHLPYTNIQLFSFCVLLIYLNINVFISMIALSPRHINLTLKIYPVAVLIALFLKVILIKNWNADFSIIVWPNLIILSLFYFLPISLNVFKKDFNYKSN